MAANGQRDAKPRVVRRLFPDDDNPDARDFLERELATARQAARERWNFDFEREVPLEGPWQWERMQTPEETDVPERPAEEGGLEDVQEPAAER